MQKKINILSVAALLLLLNPIFAGNSAAQMNPESTALHSDVELLYTQCGLDGKLDKNIFIIAFTGYSKLLRIRTNVRPVLVIADYSQPSTQERLYVIDLAGKTLIYRTLVAHGKFSGENNAQYFSNDLHSHKSSLGFYLTNGTYWGRNGYSLRLEGLEKRYNDNAAYRSIVMHGADYVSPEFIGKYGRIGRSWGCPALPMDKSREIMDYIKNSACLFVYFNDMEYLRSSTFLN